MKQSTLKRILISSAIIASTGMAASAAEICISPAVCSSLSAAAPTKTSSKRTNIEKKVKAIIVDKLGIDESEITLKANIYNDLGADSIDAIELIMEYEKAFNITIPDADAEKINTVGDAVDYLVSHTK